MIKSIFLYLAFVSAGYCGVAQVYKGSEGEVRFFSDAPLEDIEATSKKISAALKTGTGEVAVLIPIKSFIFHNGLMQEHFNESYLESDKYPDATFTGHLSSKVLDEPITEKKITVHGVLTIHGVRADRDIEISITSGAGGTLTVAGKFLVTLADHKIKIPKIVFKNIAETVDVTFVFTLKKIA